MLIDHWAVDSTIFFCYYAVHFFYCSIHHDCICINLKLKFRALSNLGVDTDFTFQLLNNEFWDCEAETHASLVNFFRLVKFPKKLEQPLNCFGFYSDTSVANSCNKTSILILKRHSDTSLECKLSCIAYEVEKHLLISFLVGLDHFWDIFINISFQIEILRDYLEIHYRHYSFNHFSNVKELLVHLELIIFNTAEI